MTEQIEKILTSLGLNKKERVVYKIIIEHGKISPTLLGRISKINRTTIYSVASELKEKGLILEDLGGKTLYYLPSSEKELDKIIKDLNREKEEKEKSIKELQEIIKIIPGSKTYSVPKIRFVDEADLESYLYEATPRWIENPLNLLPWDPSAVRAGAASTTWWGSRVSFTSRAAVH